MNKKADIMAIIIMIVVVIIAVLFFGAFQYAFHEASTTIIDSGMIVQVGNNTANVTDAAQKTFLKVDLALGGLKWIAFGIFVAMALSIFISNYLVKANPVFFIVHVCITIIATIFSVPISNAYEGLLLSGPLSSTFMSYGVINYIILNLPVFVVAIGIIGAIFLFIGVTVDREQGGSII